MRYCMTFMYDGSKYKGYQKQPHMRTIQAEIESILTKLNHGQTVRLCASGRTDAGVHALGQTAHFDFHNDIEIKKLHHALNCLLPKDIYIKKLVQVSDDFHARFDVQAKEYIYKMNLGEYNPIEKDTVYQYNHKLDLEAIKIALTYFIGTHNFKAFTKVEKGKDDFIRTIFKTELIHDNNDKDKITISFVGSGFLRYMVRNMVGTLIEIGAGKRNPQDILSIFASEDRRQAGKIASPVGLYLKGVYYDE